MTAKENPLSNVDHTWLRMDRPDNLMIITGLMTFDAPIDIERLKDLVQHSLLRHDRFHQRVVRPWLPLKKPYWQNDPYLDLEAHIERVTLSEPADQEALQDLISMIMSLDLDPSRPLWRFYVVENYGQGSALIARLHHSMADGIALMKVLLSLTDTDPDAPWPVYQPETPVRDTGSGLERRVKRVRRALKTTAGLTKALAREGAKVLNDRDYALDQVRLGASTAVAVGRLVFRWPDPKTIFKGPLGVEKRVAWSEPLSLDEIKHIGKTFNGTVNDVLLSMVTGALRRYMQAHGERVDGRDIRGFIPVNLRPIDIDDGLGNRFGLVFLTLPITIGDPLARQRRLKQYMDDLKATPEAVAALGLLYVIGGIPGRLEQVAISIFDAKATAVMTNVPGPKEQLYLAGAPINSVMAWVPQSGRVGLGVSIISYHGKVWLGVATDKGLVPDPEQIIDFFSDEFEAMQTLAQEAPERREEDIKPALSELEETLKNLDKILTEIEGLSGAPQVPEAPRCQGQTKSGQQCKNPPLTGGQYCRVHLDQDHL